MRTLQEILGWEKRTEINYANGEEVSYWLPLTFQPVTDLYPRPTADDCLMWLHLNCPTYWSFGGFPSHYWGQVGHTLRPNLSADTLLALLEQMVRYVDEFKEDLH